MPRPFCESCLIPLSIEHIGGMSGIYSYSVQRRRNLGADVIIQSFNLRHILREDDLAVAAVFSFLTETRLLHFV